MKKLQTSAIISLITAFFLMCGLRLWYTMFILLVFAVIMSLIRGNAKYCSHFCPMGMMMDNCGGEYSKKPVKIAGIKFFRPLFQLFFWGVILYFILSAETIPKLWRNMLITMISTGFFSIVLQNMFGKRFFCVNVCPYRTPFITGAIKLRRYVKK